jgi:transposase
LGLTAPWTVSRSDFDPSARRLDIEIDFAPGSRFACPTCGAADCPAYDTERMTWRRHLNFFQHQAYLNARVPRVHCDRCGVKTATVPWARPVSGFTSLFEALVMTMVSAMPVKAVARIVGEHDTRLWRVVHHYVDQARARTDASGVTRLAIDETAARRGHDYVTLFVDIDRARVVFATEGKDADTIAAFAGDLATHGGAPEAISEVCIDMSPAFIKGITENLPNAAITFDKSMPSRSSMTQLSRCAAPNRKRKACCAARVISGCAIRRRCPLVSARRSLVCPRGTSRPPVRIRSAWPFRTFIKSHLRGRARVI